MKKAVTASANCILEGSCGVGERHTVIVLVGISVFFLLLMLFSNTSLCPNFSCMAHNP